MTKTRRFNVPKPVERVTIYVNAWQYNSGAGFDWYRRPGDADTAFEEEKNNCIELKAEGWSAYRFNFVVSSKATDEEITEAIDARIEIVRLFTRSIAGTSLRLSILRARCLPIDDGDSPDTLDLFPFVAHELCAASIKQENVLAEYGCVLSEIKAKNKQPTFKAIGFSYTNKNGGTNSVICTTHALTASQKLLARYRDQKVKWLAEFVVEKAWRDREIGNQMIGKPVNKQLVAFLKKYAHPDKQEIYVNRMELAEGV